MQGHLLVAQELLNRKDFTAAEPHVGHPVDELYGALEPALRQRRVPPFLSRLESLRQQVRLDPAASSTATKFADAQQAIAAAAAAAVPAAQRSSPATLRAVVRQLGSSAATEYAGAVEGNRVVELIEYQDARGFLLAAQRLLSKAAAPTDQTSVIAGMLLAFPGVMPPRTILLSPSQLEQRAQTL
jgi:hypothetical protein